LEIQPHALVYITAVHKTSVLYNLSSITTSNQVANAGFYFSDRVILKVMDKVKCCKSSWTLQEVLHWVEWFLWGYHDLWLAKSTNFCQGYHNILYLLMWLFPLMNICWSTFLCSIVILNFDQQSTVYTCSVSLKVYYPYLTNEWKFLNFSNFIV